MKRISIIYSFVISLLSSAPNESDLGVFGEFTLENLQANKVFVADGEVLQVNEIRTEKHGSVDRVLHEAQFRVEQVLVNKSRAEVPPGSIIVLPYWNYAGDYKRKVWHSTDPIVLNPGMKFRLYSGGIDIDMEGRVLATSGDPRLLRPEAYGMPTRQLDGAAKEGAHPAESPNTSPPMGSLGAKSVTAVSSPALDNALDPPPPPTAK